jgi:sarcosine oxidase subunit beta
LNLHDSARPADVVIIGAGIVGASVAFHLTELGVDRVILLEREPAQGKGSTGKSMGGVRAQFATDVNIRMSMYSIPFLARLPDSGYRAHGYLFCAASERQLDDLRANVARQRALGLDVRLVDRDEIARIAPLLRTGDLVGGSFCPTDGFVDPYSVMNAFTQAAVARGTTLVRSAEVTGLREGCIETTAGRFRAPTVVLAAGAWSASVAAMAGAQLPVTPLRRMLVPAEPFAGIPERLPMVVDMSTGFHFRPEARGVLMAWNDPEETPGFKTGFDPAFVEKILTRAVDRVPAFEALEVNPKRAWAGLYDMSPDHHAILGPAPEAPWLFYACGFSGHGVMHSPATGKIVADLIVKGSTDLIDVGILNVRRFAEGRSIQETVLL